MLLLIKVTQSIFIGAFRSMEDHALSTLFLHFPLPPRMLFALEVNRFFAGLSTSSIALTRACFFSSTVLRGFSLTQVFYDHDMG